MAEGIRLEDEVERIRLEVKVGDLRSLRRYFNEKHPAEIAHLLSFLREEHQERIFSNILDDETIAELAGFIDEYRYLVLLFKRMRVKRLVRILELMPSDDRVDLLDEFKARRVNRLLDLLSQEDAEETRQLLSYPDDVAGGIMSAEFVTADELETAEDALERVRCLKGQVETLYNIYVITEDGRLIGVVSLAEVLVADSSTTIGEIMNPDVIQVNASDDQELVADLVTNYDLSAIPVVDDAGRIAGIVTVDDVIDVIRDEATEDTYRMAGITEPDVEPREIFDIGARARHRLPWLFVTLSGGVLAGTVLNLFEDVLQVAIGLAYFVPLVMGMGGNVGTQASALVIRGLALGRLDQGRITRFILNQARVGATLGAVFGAIVAAMATLWHGNSTIGGVVGGAMFVDLIWSATIGSLLPILFDKLGMDPATASGPIITTMNDSIALLIYFGLAAAFT
ncbi:MAG: magnesium transporter [Candidatus Bipolaricaulia bacterium]